MIRTMNDHAPKNRAGLRYLDPAYRHHSKLVMPQAGIELNRARLKWYDLARAEAPVPNGIRQMARDYLTAEADAGRLELDAEMGFVVLHFCGKEFFFLIISTWRGNNELWESVYYKQDAAMPGFALFPRDNRHKGAYCVWELGPVWHEKEAWVRFLNSQRDDAAERVYLEDRFAGTV